MEGKAGERAVREGPVCPRVHLGHLVPRAAQSSREATASVWLLGFSGARPPTASVSVGSEETGGEGPA